MWGTLIINPLIVSLRNISQLHFDSKSQFQILSKITLKQCEATVHYLQYTETNNKSLTQFVWLFIWPS